MIFSKAFWEKIKRDGITQLVYDFLNLKETRGNVWYKTDWTKSKKEIVVDYLVRQFDSKKAIELVESKRHLWESMTSDEKVRYWFAWVRQNIKYEFDKVQFGVLEKWEDLDIVLTNMEGDCETQATLLYVLCSLSGVSFKRLRLYAGDVIMPSGKKGGHVWLQYRRDIDGNQVIMDTTYYPTWRSIDSRDWAYDESKYIDRWWGFNEARHYRGWR